MLSQPVRELSNHVCALHPHHSQRMRVNRKDPSQIMFWPPVIGLSAGLRHAWTVGSGLKVCRPSLDGGLALRNIALILASHAPGQLQKLV